MNLILWTLDYIQCKNSIDFDAWPWHWQGHRVESIQISVYLLLLGLTWLDCDVVVAWLDYNLTVTWQWRMTNRVLDLYCHANDNSWLVFQLVLQAFFPFYFFFIQGVNWNALQQNWLHEWTSYFAGFVMSPMRSADRTFRYIDLWPWPWPDCC